MRHTLSATEVNLRLADALRQAESGDLVVITRYRKPVAALVGGARLERLDRLEDAGGAEDGGPGVETADWAAGAPGAAGEPTPEELRQRAAAGAMRRIEADLARLPERLKPALRLIRANLFQPRLTVEWIKAALGVKAHDYTSDFGRAAGVSIHQYFTNRRLEAAARLLVDTELRVKAIALLVGYSGSEALSRAFKKRHGVRPPIYRELAGQLSLEVAGDAGADRPPILPRYVAGTAAVAPEAVCGRCRRPLAAGTARRVFEDLAPICPPCAHRQAPELAAMLWAG